MGIPIGATGASDVEASKQTNKQTSDSDTTVLPWRRGIPWRRGLLQVFFSLPAQPTRLSVGLTGGNLCVRHRGPHPSLAHARGSQAGQAPGASAAAHVRAGTCPPRTPSPRALRYIDFVPNANGSAGGYAVQVCARRSPQPLCCDDAPRHVRRGLRRSTWRATGANALGRCVAR